MQFPLEGRSGNGIPLWGREMGYSFPKRSFRETTSPLWSRILGCTFPDELKGENASRFETRFWDVVSRAASAGKYVPF